MGSSWPVVCAAVLLWALLSSASTGFDEQREVTFDLDQKGIEALMQKEVDWKDLFDPEDSPIEQIMESPPEKFDTLSERGGSTPRPRGRRPNVQPRSFGGPPSLDYPVQFPLSRPTPENIQAICLHGDRRPRYPDSYFPASGFGQLKRRASAINKAESWFSTCCEGNQTSAREVTLCCATQAWELSVKSFCQEDSSVKDRLYRCCKLTGKDMFNCFNKDSPNPNYEPTEEIPLPPLPSTAIFTFDPNTCQRTVMTPRSDRGDSRSLTLFTPKTGVTFPPARPTEDSIQSLCRYQSFRPHYDVKAMWGKLMASQAKTVNRLETRFKRCCKKKRNMLKCAVKKWTRELNSFCSANKKFYCCSSYNRLSCLHDSSPDPLYNVAALASSIDKVCNTPSILTNKIPGIDSITKCCTLLKDEKITCVVGEMNGLSASLCSSGGAALPTVARCCNKPQPVIPDCVVHVVTDIIVKASEAV